MNLRHIRSSEYLARFRLHVKYKSGKTNTISDALSRLPVAIDVRDYLLKAFIIYEVMAHPIAIVEMLRVFKDRIKQGYENDRRCQRVIAMV